MRRKKELHEGRAQLLRSAAEAFASVGFAGASVGDIARAAKVTQPLVNHHFGSKKGLWQAVVDEQFTALEQTLLECDARHAAGDELDRLRELLRAYVTFCGQRPQLTRMLRIEADSALAREVHRRWQSRFVAFFEGRIESAIAHQVIAPLDPQFLFFVIVGAATEIFAQPDLARRTFELDVADPAVIDRAASFVCDFILRGAARPA